MDKKLYAFLNGYMAKQADSEHLANSYEEGYGREPARSMYILSELMNDPHQRRLMSGPLLRIFSQNRAMAAAKQALTGEKNPYVPERFELPEYPHTQTDEERRHIFQSALAPTPERHVPFEIAQMLPGQFELAYENSKTLPLDNSEYVDRAALQTFPELYTAATNTSPTQYPMFKRDNIVREKPTTPGIGDMLSSARANKPSIEALIAEKVKAKDADLAEQPLLSGMSSPYAKLKPGTAMSDEMASLLAKGSSPYAKLKPGTAMSDEMASLLAKGSSPYAKLKPGTAMSDEMASLLAKGSSPYAKLDTSEGDRTTANKGNLISYKAPNPGMDKLMTPAPKNELAGAYAPTGNTAKFEADRAARNNDFIARMQDRWSYLTPHEKMAAALVSVLGAGALGYGASKLFSPAKKTKKRRVQEDVGDAVPA